MSTKKIVTVTLGVAAGLVAIAPLASAHDSQPGGGGNGGGAPRGSTDICSVKGGSAAAQNGIQGDSFVNGVVQAPVGGANALNIVCNSILNDNLSDNMLGLDVL